MDVSSLSRLLRSLSYLSLEVKEASPHPRLGVGSLEGSSLVIFRVFIFSDVSESSGFSIVKYINALPIM